MDNKSIVDGVLQMAAMVRDQYRPTLQFAGDAISKFIKSAVAIMPSTMVLVEAGPQTWRWESSDGLRFLTLSESALDGAEGYPLLTMRQVLCAPLDNQVTTSTLMVGNTEVMIANGLTTLLTNHAAAVGGISAISRVSVDGGDIFAELDRIEGKDTRTLASFEEMLTKYKAVTKKDDGSN